MCVCMYVCVCMCIKLYMFVCMYVYIYTCMFVFMYVHDGTHVVENFLLSLFSTHPTMHTIHGMPFFLPLDVTKRNTASF